MLLNAMVFALLTAALFLFTGVRLSIPERKSAPNRPETRKQKRMRITGRKKPVWERHKDQVEKAIKEARMRMSWNIYLRLLAGCALLGALFGLPFDNPLLSVFMAVSLPMLPYRLLLLKGVAYRRQLHAQVEDALGMITATYMQSEDIYKAVSAHVPVLESPLKDLFSDFVNQVYVGTSMVQALSHIRGRVNNRFWHDWVDCLIQCQDDRDMKVLLPSIVDELAGMRRVQASLDTLMIAIWRDHILVSVMVGSSIPLMRLMSEDWYAYLTGTFFGRVVVCLTFASIFFATLYVMRINKPLSMEGENEDVLV